MERGAPSALARSRAFWLAVACGVAVRTVGLFDQVLVGDEMHAFRFARETPLGETLATYSNTANSPPINVWLRAFLELGVPPGELALRIPVLLSGVALLVWAPFWIARRFDGAVAVAAAWLLALSPLLVFYSRFMRPYMPYALVATLAAAAFFDWWRERRLAAGLVYAVCAALAVYFHLLAAPFVVAPFVFLAIEALLAGPRVLPPWRQVLAVGGLFGGLVLTFVVPGWASIRTLIDIRREPIDLQLQDFVGAVARLSGPYTGYCTVLLLAFAVYGAVVAWRRDPALARYGLVLLLLPYAALPLLSPRYIANGIIYSRYLLPLTVPLLTAAALGMAVSPWSRGRRAWHAVSAVAFLVVVANSPVSDADLYGNPAGVRPAILVGRHHRPLRDDEVPPLYRRLADGSPGAVIEAPARPAEVYLRRLAEYHRVHGRPIRTAGDAELADEALGLRSVLPLDPPALLATDAAFLIIHRDWAVELGERHGLPRAARQSLHRLLRGLSAGFEEDAARFVGDATEVWGPPDLADETLVIWDLARVRGGPGAAP